MGGTVEDFGNTLLDTIVQGSTSGLVGVEEGEIKEGVLGKELVKGAKEITGAAAQERAIEKQEERFQEEQVRVEEELSFEREETQRDRTRRSRAAGTARATSRASASPASQRLGASSKDFLGL